MNTLKHPHFKHSIIAALVISLSGISFASWADESPAPAATLTGGVTTTASAPTSADDHAARKARWEAFRAKHEQERIQRRTEMFQQADTNHDSKVSLEEWLAFKPQHRDFQHNHQDRHQDGQEGQKDEHQGREHRDHGKDLTDWLKKVDANHDGKISPAEAESYAPWIAKHFAEIDTNHDGLISKDELKAFFDAKKSKWEERIKQHRTEEFQKADTNHDGQLTLQEWLAFKPHHHHHHGFWHHHGFGGHHHGFWGHDHHEHGNDHAGRFDDWFKKIDTNHDGFISLSEAQAGAPEIAKHFNEIDTDHNGQISQDELHAYFKAQHEKSQS